MLFNDKATQSSKPNLYSSASSSNGMGSIFGRHKRTPSDNPTPEPTKYQKFLTDTLKSSRTNPPPEESLIGADDLNFQSNTTPIKPPLSARASLDIKKIIESTPRQSKRSPSKDGSELNPTPSQYSSRSDKNSANQATHSQGDILKSIKNYYESQPSKRPIDQTFMKPARISSGNTYSSIFSAESDTHAKSVPKLIIPKLESNGFQMRQPVDSKVSTRLPETVPVQASARTIQQAKSEEFILAELDDMEPPLKSARAPQNYSTPVKTSNPPSARSQIIKPTDSDILSLKKYLGRTNLAEKLVPGLTKSAPTQKVPVLPIPVKQFEPIVSPFLNEKTSSELKTPMDSIQASPENTKRPSIMPMSLVDQDILSDISPKAEKTEKIRTSIMPVDDLPIRPKTVTDLSTSNDLSTMAVSPKTTGRNLRKESTSPKLTARSMNLDETPRRTIRHTISMKRQKTVSLTMKFSEFILSVIKLKRSLKRKYYFNRNEYGKYDPNQEPVFRRIFSRNEELIERRDQFYKQDIDYYFEDEKQRQEDCEIEAFDFNSYTPEVTKKKGIPAEIDNKQFKVLKSATINKLRRENKSFHPRWMVLRGFDLYWYREPIDKKAKGIIPLPITPIKEMKVETVGKNCMILPEGKGRELIFLSDHVGMSWKVLLSNQIAYKYYMEYVYKKTGEVNNNLVQYFNKEDFKNFEISNAKFDDPSVLSLFFESIPYHAKLRDLALVNVGLKGTNLDRLMQLLKLQKKSIRLESLSLDNNNLGKESVTPLMSYLESAFSLTKLSLNDNPLGDSAIQSLAETMISRLDKMNQDSKKNWQLPLLRLDISNCRCGDQGIFGLISFLDRVNKKVTAKGFEEQPELMKIDLSKNLFSDNGIRALAKLLSTFYGIEVLNISYNDRLTPEGFKELMRNMPLNYSLSELLYLGNALNEDCVTLMLRNMEENFVLKRISITLKKEQISYVLRKEDTNMKYYNII